MGGIGFMKQSQLDLTGRKNLLYNRISKEIEMINLEFERERMNNIVTDYTRRRFNQRKRLHRAIQKLLDEIFMGEEE